MLSNLKISIAVDAIKISGNLAYEYHPFRNYLLETNTCIKDGFYIPEGKAVNKLTGQILEKKNNNNKWLTLDNIIVDNEYILEYDSKEEIIPKDSLVDLDTELFNFDLNHPVEMEILPSYDGSVNIILNDDKNITRLINSRFSAREKNTYEIVDRVGENDTNIYGQNSFDKDTALYFLCSKEPIIEYKGLINGELLVGLYCFYITYCDADENESDIVAESGLIPIFIGLDGDNTSIDGGIKNQLSHKGIKLNIKNLDSNYNYIKIYLFRYFSDYLQNRVGELKKFYKKYTILQNSELTIQITGIEEAEDLDPNYLNISKFNAKSILTQAQCKNRLFFGNIERNIDNYKELSDLAIRIIPEVNKLNTNQLVNSSTGDSNLIKFDLSSSTYNYSYTGYYPQEFYRFGVVFIYNNGTLSNVYNTLGKILNGYTFEYKSSQREISELLYSYDSVNNIYERIYVNSDIDGFIDNKNISTFIKEDYLNKIDWQFNSKGVCKVDVDETNTDSIGITFKVHKDIINELNKLGIRGMFFVRLKRIPEVIAQCMILPMDKYLEAPVINGKDSYYTESFISLYDDKLKLFISSHPEYSILRKDTIRRISNSYPGELTNDYALRLINYTLNDDIDKESKTSRTLEARYVIDSIDESNESHKYYINLTGAKLENGKWKYSLLDSISKKAFAGICPDFLLNQPYYNQIFNGSKFRLKRESIGYLEFKKDRFWNYNSYDKIWDIYKLYLNSDEEISAKICTVTEDVNTVSIEDLAYRLNIGQAEEAYSFKTAGDSLDTVKNLDTNLVRGIYSPYLAIYITDVNKKLLPGIYSIYKDEDETEKLKILKRINSYEPYYSISDRIQFKDFKNLKLLDDLILQVIDCYRGDCYYNSFTYRLNRNFNDPSLPNNDVILKTANASDESGHRNWQSIVTNGLTSPNEEAILNLSRGDTNAVQLGSWLTFPVKSSFNYIYRSEDHSFVSEEALMGSPRTFYPKVSKPWLGVYKMPDSYLYNDAFRASLGPKCYYTLENINYIKNRFSNRILYSEIAIQDSYKNNYRSSLSTYFRDYSQEYGSILKLIGFEGYLLVVFEHAIGIAVINERVLSGQGDGEPVFINVNNVLPEELTIISDTYGTQWPESVIKTEAGFVYGVDTVAKKIWKIKGKEIELISDFKVNEFLQNNITLSERELTPTIGLINVKTHYNNNKKDVMFTFYDDVYRNEEKAWNLCYNELLDLFVTFYSWVPSYSENIDTLYFSFDRNTSKNLALLHKSNYWIPNNYGVLVDTPLIETLSNIKVYYREKELDEYSIQTIDGIKIVLNIKNDKIIYYKNGVKFSLEHDCLGNYKLFNETRLENESLLVFNDNVNYQSLLNKIIYLYITPYLEKRIDENLSEFTYYKTELIAITLRKNLEYNKDYKYFKNDFYLHGNSGIIDILNPLLPCWWYDSLHPFEFEFIVNDKVNYLKIFSDLVIISNKAEPESFHFEIEGDNYEFSSDKRNMYFRLESTKNLYLNMGSDILFDRDFTKCAWDTYTEKREQYYKSDDYLYKSLYKKLDKVYPVEGGSNLIRLVKSTIFPLYYERIDTYDDIYDKYELIDGINKYDFKNLSGSEVKWNKRANLFNIVTHIKNTPIDKYGRIRGNSRYKEGKWHIQIPSITFMLKNEKEWPVIKEENIYLKRKVLKDAQIPPIIISKVPNDLSTYDITRDKLPNIYYGNNIGEYIKTSEGWTLRKETKIRDKWIKIRVRYSGKNLAIIHSVVTLYNISYS